MYILSNANLSSMPQADFLGFCTLYQKHLAQLGEAPFGLETATLERFRGHLNQFTDCCKSTQASQLTGSVQEADAERSRLFKGLRSKLQNLQYCSRPDVVKLFPRVKKYITDLYGPDIATHAANRKTALISGLLLDLQKFSTADLNTLGISADMQALDAANELFLTHAVNRNIERGSQSLGFSATVRNALLEDVQVIGNAACFWANRTELADNEKEYPMQAQQFVAAVNAMIGRMRQSAGIAEANTGTTEEKPDSGTNTGSGSNTQPSQPSTGGNSSSGSGSSAGNSGSDNSGSNSGNSGSSSGSGSSSSGGGKVPDPGHFL